MTMLQQQTNGIVHPSDLKPNGVKHQNGNVNKNGHANGSVHYSKQNQHSFQNGIAKEASSSKVSLDYFSKIVNYTHSFKRIGK